MTATQRTGAPTAAQLVAWRRLVARLLAPETTDAGKTTNAAG